MSKRSVLYQEYDTCLNFIAVIYSLHKSSEINAMQKVPNHRSCVPNYQSLLKKRWKVKLVTSD